MLLAVLVGGLSSPGRASADEPDPGLLRLAHLSPDTPAVDVSVTPAAPPGRVLTDAGPTLAAGLRYGDVRAHHLLRPGAYAVSVRAAGAPATTPPALSVRVEVAAGEARTVALVGRFAGLGLRTLPDDLSPPAAGTTRVRVVAAAPTATPLDVSLRDGVPLAADLSFPDVGAYATVPGGRHVLHVPGLAGDVPVDLPAGSVVTVLALADPGGRVTLRTVVDATGPQVLPVGGVEAGGGPASPATGWLPRALTVLAAARAHAAVAPGAESVAVPIRVRVPAAGIDAPVTVAGLDGSGALVPPADPGLAGWFTGGPRPGAPGPAVLTGHRDGAGRLGVLGGLAAVTPGDEVVVDRADGTVARFRVTAVDRYAKAAFPTDTVYGPTTAPGLRLITCGGPFDEDRGSYRDNVVVSARLVH